MVTIVAGQEGHHPEPPALNQGDVRPTLRMDAPMSISDSRGPVRGLPMSSVGTRWRNG